MMDFRQRLEQNRNTPANSEPPAIQPDGQLSCPYFATDRTGTPACLDLRLKDGKRTAIPYAYFTEMNFDSESGIELHTSGKRIAITGRNLTPLFDALLTYRVRFVQVDIGSDTREDGVFVRGIVIEG